MDDYDYRATPARLTDEEWFAEINRVVLEAKDAKCISKAPLECHICGSEVQARHQSTVNKLLFLCDDCRTRKAP